MEEDFRARKSLEQENYFKKILVNRTKIYDPKNSFLKKNI